MRGLPGFLEPVRSTPAPAGTGAGVAADSRVRRSVVPARRPEKAALRARECAIFAFNEGAPLRGRWRAVSASVWACVRALICSVALAGWNGFDRGRLQVLFCEGGVCRGGAGMGGGAPGCNYLDRRALLCCEGFPDGSEKERGGFGRAFWSLRRTMGVGIEGSRAETYGTGTARSRRGTDDRIDCCRRYGAVPRVDTAV